MGIKATWTNLRKGVAVRCLYGNEDQFKTATIISAKGEGDIDGDIKVDWDDEVSNNTGWGQRTSFELIGPILTSENAYLGAKVRLVDGNVASNKKLPLGLIGSIRRIEKEYVAVDLINEIHEFEFKLNALELQLEPASWKTIAKYTEVICIKQNYRKFGMRAVIEEVVFDEYWLKWANGETGRWVDPEDIAVITVSQHVKLAQNPSPQPPTPTAKPFDWDSYTGIKPLGGKFVLSPYGGVIRVDIPKVTNKP